MRTQKRTNAVWMSSRVPWLAPAVVLFVVAASSHAASNEAGISADSRITVTTVAGDVSVTMAGNAATVSPSSTVLLPARIVTGHDGTLGLTQAGTTISVSSDTDVEIPAEAVDGNLVARLVQHSGNVFYDVAPRDLGKLRVETPFLVAVIKGTQFNVAVEDDGTTISLFEGHLEIRTPDDSDVVELNAGEIAIRSLIDDSIRIIGMDDLRVAVPPAPAAPAARSGTEAASAAAPERGAVVADQAPAGSVNDVAVGAEDEGLLALRRTAVDLAIGTESPGLRVGRDGDNPGLSHGRDGEHPGLGGGRHTVDGGGVELAVDIGLDADLDTGAPSVEIDVDVRTDLGEAGLDLGEALDVDLDTTLDLDTAMDTGATIDDGSIDLLDGVLDLDLSVDPLGSIILKPKLEKGQNEPRPTPRGGPDALLGALP